MSLQLPFHFGHREPACRHLRGHRNLTRRRTKKASSWEKKNPKKTQVTWGSSAGGHGSWRTATRRRPAGPAACMIPAWEPRQRGTAQQTRGIILEPCFHAHAHAGTNAASTTCSAAGNLLVFYSEVCVNGISMESVRQVGRKITVRIRWTCSASPSFNLPCHWWSSTCICENIVARWTV